MFPILFSLGPIEIRSMTVMVALALFFGLFAFWRKTKEEHYDEFMVFDGMLLSLIAGFVLARIVFIFLFFDRFGWNFVSWIDIFSNPGFNVFALFVGSGLFLFRYSKKKKWDAYEMLDFWSVGMSIALACIWIGFWLAGTGFGTATQLPWGMVFPGLVEPHHPVQLYYTMFFAVLAYYLSWVEYRYRTFSWYRAHKNAAQTGFLIGVMMLASGVWTAFLLLFTFPSATLVGVRIDLLAALFLIASGAWVLYQRSGQEFLKFLDKK